MIPRVTEVRHVGLYVVYVRFADGTEGEVDLEGELDGEVFEPLRDPAVFAQATVHPELHTVSWPNGADLAPEFLYDKVRLLV